MLTICSQHADQWAVGRILTILTICWLLDQDHSYDVDHPEA